MKKLIFNPNYKKRRKKGSILLSALIISIIALFFIATFFIVATKKSSLKTEEPVPYLRGPDLTQIVEDELNTLAKGQILFNPPQKMKVGIKERVEVRIAKTITEDLNAGLKGHGVPIIEEIRVGTFMRARLKGDNFNIEALSEKDQLVAGEGFTQWNYNVTPLKSGIQSLSLTVTVRIKLPGNVEETKEIEVFDREISIHVNISYTLKKFIKNYWWGIITAIIVPIVLLIIKMRWDSKKKIRRKIKKGKNK